MKKITFDISLRVLGPDKITLLIFFFLFCCEYPNKKLSSLFADKCFYVLYMCNWQIHKAKAIVFSDLEFQVPILCTQAIALNQFIKIKSKATQQHYVPFN